MFAEKSGGFEAYYYFRRGELCAHHRSRSSLSTFYHRAILAISARRRPTARRGAGAGVGKACEAAGAETRARDVTMASRHKYLPTNDGRCVSRGAPGDNLGGDLPPRRARAPKWRESMLTSAASAMPLNVGAERATSPMLMFASVRAIFTIS